MPKCSAVISLANVDDGASGRGVSSTAVTYQSSSNGTSAPTGTWSQSIPAVSAGNYLWTRTIITYTDGTSSTIYSVGKMGETGANGDKGNTGKGISSIVEYYAVSASNSTVPSSWGTSMPTLTATSKYLWNYTRYTYTDGTYVDTTKIVIGTYGDKGDTGSTGSTGVGVSSIAEKYAVSSSNSTEPTSWQDTVPTLTATNRYLWNYEIFTLTNGTTTTTKKRVIGVYGDKGATGTTGNGISSIVNYYLASASGSGITNASNGFTTTIQTLTVTLKYLWNYELITYTNGTTAKSPACVIGVYGDKGATGATGPKGDKGDTGAKGNTGASGADAVSAELSISSIQIPVNVSGNVRDAMTVECVFSGYKGTTSQTCTATVGTLPTCITASVNNTSRMITFTIAKNGTLGNALAGLIAVTISVLGVSFTKKLSWVKVVDAQSLQTEIEAQADSITSINSSISSVSSELANKAAQTDLASLQGTVADNSSAISGLATRVTSSEGRISANATSITNNADAIKLKASQTDLNTLNETVSSHGTQITQTADDVTALATRVTHTENANSSQATSIQQNADAIATKASSIEVNNIKTRLSSAETSITQKATIIQLNAVESSVDTLTGEVNQNTASIITNAENITSLVTKTDNTNSRVDDAEGNITTAQSSIRQNADAINLKVSAIGKNGAAINDAKIDVEVTEDGSHILLDADKVLVSGSVKADKIDVTALMAQDLLIGSSIHNDKYLADGTVNEESTATSGFYVNKDGKLKAKDADFDSVSISGNSTFSGSVTNAFLKTRAFSDSNESYTLTTTRNWWYESTLYSLISPKGVNSIIGASGSFNGVALSYMLCCNSTGAYISLKATEAIGFGQTKQWTSTINGKVSISFNAPSYSYEDTEGSWSVSTSEESGLSVPESESRPVNPSDGDTYRTYKFKSGSSQGVTYTVKTYTYHEHTSTKTNQVNCRLLLNGTTEIYNGSSGYRVGIDVSKGNVISLIAESTSNSLHANGDWKIDIKFDSTGVKFIDTNGTISHVKSSMWYKTPFTISSPVSTSSSSIAAKFSPNADFFAPNKTLSVMYSLDPSSRIAGKVAVSFMKIDASHVVLQYLDGTSLKSLSVASDSMLDENFGGTIKIANTPGGIDVGTILPIAATDIIGSAEKPFREVRATTMIGNVNASGDGHVVWGAVAN